MHRIYSYISSFITHNTKKIKIRKNVHGNEDEDKLLHKDIDRNEYKNENEGKNEIKLEFRTRFSLPIISHFNS